MVRDPRQTLLGDQRADYRHLIGAEGMRRVARLELTTSRIVRRHWSLDGGSVAFRICLQRNG
jgi:hypothetical protein